MSDAASAEHPAAQGLQGLSRAEAAAILQRDGPNELQPRANRGVARIAGEAAREPMFQLLVAAGLIYLALGDLGEALVLLAFVSVTVTITIVQERRAERVLEALRDLTSPRALVLREGVEQRITGREVVCGDLLLLSDGDRVPADARLLAAHDLRLDESLLTGESLPVAKRAATADDEPAQVRPGGDGLPFVYAGTMITGGQGLAQVFATGARSEIGRIGRALAEIASPPTPLQQQTRRLVRIFSVLGLTLSAWVVLLYGLTRQDWLGGLLAGITLAMAMLPEEFTLILTVFMAMGGWRLSRQRVLARRSATIEALGAATVLCSDKTGTLTRNQMAVAELVLPAGAGWRAGEPALPMAMQPLLEAAVLASEPQPTDPMDRAFHALAATHCPAAARLAHWQLVKEYPLEPGLPVMTHAWRDPARPERLRLAAKGAPEAVIALCRLPEAAARALAAQTHAMAERGLRVLAVAQAQHDAGAPWPDSPRGFAFEFLGLAALADPLRPGVPEAVQACRAAGIRVLMVTGDHPATATAIARQAGLDGAAPTLGGAELAAMDEAALRRALATHQVFARVLPEQKLRIVQALKADGQVVAMTGDGVNDAPSMKAAHIGIAMGGRGTDVAREASALVLLDDDFNSIVQAVRLGRHIVDNLRKAMAFVLAVHVPIAGLSLLPLLLGWPPLFAPVHIAFLELLIDPVCSIVFEAEPQEDDVMRRPPRDPAAPLFSAALIARGLLQGALVLLLVGGFYGALLAGAWPAAAARAAAFAALVAGFVALILGNRALGGPSWRALLRPNRALWLMAATAAALLALVLSVAPLRAVFGFMPPPAALLAAAAGIGLAVLLALQAGIWLRHRFKLGAL